MSQWNFLSQISQWAKDFFTIDISADASDLDVYNTISEAAKAHKAANDLKITELESALAASKTQADQFATDLTKQGTEMLAFKANIEKQIGDLKTQFAQELAKATSGTKTEPDDIADPLKANEKKDKTKAEASGWKTAKPLSVKVV